MIAGTAHRVAHATRKVTKVARTLGHGARILAKPGSKVEVTVMSKALGEAPEKYHFVLKDGRRLRSLYELVDELETMSDDTFRHYANEFKNDFANWTRDVFDEKHLAEEISRMQHRIDMQRAILKHLVRELKRVAPRKK
ncbi:MAG: DUF5752 family protein [Nanoarchaeota archaeon]